jgi:hypothetical protein
MFTAVNLQYIFIAAVLYHQIKINLFKSEFGLYLNIFYDFKYTG